MEWKGTERGILFNGEVTRQPSDKEQSERFSKQHKHKKEQNQY